MAKVDPVDVTKIGAEATLAPTARDQSLVGRRAVVAKAIKSRGEYLLRFDHGQSYYAFARNVVFL